MTKKEEQKTEAKTENETEEIKETKEKPKVSKEQELLISLQHLQADFENFRKRTEKNQQDFIKFAGQSFIEKLLPSLDNFELAMKNKDDSEFAKAIEMVYVQMWETLQRAGLQKIQAVGKPFNPTLHQPLTQEESEEEPGTVLEEVQPGFTFHDKLIRHAMVKVAKAKDEVKKNE